MLLILLAIIICQTGDIETRCTNCSNDCDITGNCNNCPENCGNCTHSSIKLSCDTCKAGFYGPTCNLPCPDNCQDRECNKMYMLCSKGCNIGYHGNLCDQTCSMGCQDRECNNSNGFCSKGCVLGYFGDKCHFNCSHGCQGKECNKDGVCTNGCNFGLYGDRCDQKCPIGCQDTECNKDGACKNECLSGLYGERCDQNCSIGCQDMECNKYGACKNECISGLYGDKCDRNCSKRCQYIECNKDGACSKGCAVGYHGYLCNVSCSRACRYKTCDRLNGACTHGCIEGHDVETCHLCNNCNKEIPLPQHHEMIPVMIGLAIGASILVAGAVALILLIRRSRRQRRANSRGVNSERQYNKSNIRNPIHDAAIGNDNTIATSEARPNSVDPVYSFVQKTSQRRCNKMNQSVPDGNIYDVTSTERQPERFQRWTKMGAVITGDDTYSHISHVTKMGRFVDGQHGTVESVYNHITHNFGRQGIEGTYNVAMNNKEQPSGTGTERLPTTNSQDHDDGINKQNHMNFNTNHQFARVPQYHEMYSTVSEVLPEPKN